MTTTPTAAARVSGTIKALYERACDLVHHEADCPARGRCDEYCKCDAVPFLNDFEALAEIQTDPEPQPVAWQWRYRADTTNGNWSEWSDGKAPNLRGSAYETEDRPLYATPSSAGTVSVEAAAKVIVDAWDSDTPPVNDPAPMLPAFITALRALAGEGGR